MPLQESILAVDGFQLPTDVKKADSNIQLGYLQDIARIIVDQCTIIDTNVDVPDTTDGIQYTTMLEFSAIMVLL